MSKVRWGVLSTANIGLQKVLPAMQRGQYCDITAIASRDLAQHRAMLSQHVHVTFPFTVEEVVQMGAGDRGGASARALVEKGGSLAVPLELRNAPTRLMKGLGYGQGYQYDHDADQGIAFGQRGFPEEIGEQALYQPVERGMEAKIRERLEWIRARRREALGGS